MPRSQLKSIPYDKTAIANPPRLTTTVGHDPPVSPPTIAFPPVLHLYNRTHLHWHERICLGTRKSQPSFWVTTHILSGTVNLRHENARREDAPLARYVRSIPPYVTFPDGRHDHGRAGPVHLEGLLPPYRF